MEALVKRLKQRPVRILGLMSGTSLDGLDIALVQWTGEHVSDFELEAFATYQYPEKIKNDIQESIQRDISHACQLNFELGRIWAENIYDFLKQHEISSEQITCIASHGQTIWHISGKSTLQIGEPALLREQTGIPVISNFRERDIAAGGTGAPLIPYLDWILFSRLSGNTVVLNLGGIANITCVSENISQDEVRAWDTGPGNMVVNSLVREYFGDEPGYDENGAIAQSGKIIPELLSELLEDTFVTESPPKSTGREYYSEEYITEKLIQPASESQWDPADVIRTVSEWTVASVAKNVQTYWTPISGISRVIVSGGGAFNTYFVERLASHFSNADILPSNEFGIPVEAKEAIGFAVFGYAFIHNLSASMPAVTGAREQVILGKLTP